MNKYLKIASLLVLVLLLVLVRMYENALFYDPFMHFFQGCLEMEEQLFPGHWYLNVALRYLVNTIVSLAIIYVVFEDKGAVKFSAFLYLILFLVLYPLFIYLMERVEREDYLFVFYVRRFLVQPLLILLLLPALYYQQFRDRKPEN